MLLFVTAPRVSASLDCYGAGLLGLDGSQVSRVRRASAHGLGQIDLARVRVRTIDVE